MHRALCSQYSSSMAVTKFSSSPAHVSSLLRRDITRSTAKFRSNFILVSPRQLPASTSTSTSQSTVASTIKASVNSFPENGRVVKKRNAEETGVSESKMLPFEERANSEDELGTLKDYFEQSVELIRSDSGPPRWLSPLKCGSRLNDSPLLLFLPGPDGVGLGLVTHHKKLGSIFDVWCLHIPLMDRTPFTDLLKLVEDTVKTEHQRPPKRPIYLVGESLGACLALAVAARNPDIDLVLILANPATCFSKTQLQLLIPFLDVTPDSFHVSLPYILSLVTGNSMMTVMTSLGKGLPLDQIFGELSQDLVAISSYLLVLADKITRETVVWKLQMLRSASAYANSHLHAVKCESLILLSGRDELLPSLEEGERLRHIMPRCVIRRFCGSGHFLFLERGFDLVNIIKGTSFYRRREHLDYVSDYVQPTHNELSKMHDDIKHIIIGTSPVMLSTLENGEIVRGIAGIPSQGPVLLVGNHMLLGFDMIPLLRQIVMERNTPVRGIAHPCMFVKSREGLLGDLPIFDSYRIMGAVPVSGTNFHKLLASKSLVLLYPGGLREALHRKGELYKLFWPEKFEFVRMAARFGAKIVPFGVVGEDDISEVIFDYDDQMKIPFLKDFIEALTNEAVRVRADMIGEVANQDLHIPVFRPKFPGRFYYYFGKTFETEDRKKELRDRDKAHELYIEVKREVERCLEYLKEKRERDPYRNLLPRLLYQVSHGFTSDVPTFEI